MPGTVLWSCCALSDSSQPYEAATVIIYHNYRLTDNTEAQRGKETEVIVLVVNSRQNQD